MAATQSFESLERDNVRGDECWIARDLQPLPGYSQWRRLEQAIGRAITSCETSGNANIHIELYALTRAQLEARAQLRARSRVRG